MRVDGLRRVLERVVREVLPVLDDGLVLEELRPTYRKQGEKGGEGGTDLVDVFPTPDELFFLPARQDAELGADEADLARPAPRDRRRPAERDELAELLQGPMM